MTIILASGYPTDISFDFTVEGLLIAFLLKSN